jgi:hypothetical protein
VCLFAELLILAQVCKHEWILLWIWVQ